MTGDIAKSSPLPSQMNSPGGSTRTPTSGSEEQPCATCCVPTAFFPANLKAFALKSLRNVYGLRSIARQRRQQKKEMTRTVAPSSSSRGTQWITVFEPDASAVAGGFPSTFRARPFVVEDGKAWRGQPRSWCEDTATVWKDEGKGRPQTEPSIGVSGKVKLTLRRDCGAPNGEEAAWVDENLFCWKAVRTRTNAANKQTYPNPPANRISIPQSHDSSTSQAKPTPFATWTPQTLAPLSTTVVNLTPVQHISVIPSEVRDKVSHDPQLIDSTLARQNSVEEARLCSRGGASRGAVNALSVVVDLDESKLPSLETARQMLCHFEYKVNLKEAQQYRCAAIASPSDNGACHHVGRQESPTATAMQLSVASVGVDDYTWLLCGRNNEWYYWDEGDDWGGQEAEEDDEGGTVGDIMDKNVSMAHC